MKLILDQYWTIRMEDPFDPLSWSVSRLLGPRPLASLIPAAKAIISFDWTDTVHFVLLSHAGKLGPITQTNVHRSAFELARFLLLAVSEKSSASLSPCASVDEIWHALMLSPLAYSNLCIAMCGVVIDHDPLRIFSSTLARDTRLARVSKIYLSTFNEGQPSAVWGDSDSSAAESGTVTHSHTAVWPMVSDF